MKKDEEEEEKKEREKYKNKPYLIITLRDFFDYLIEEVSLKKKGRFKEK